MEREDMMINEMFWTAYAIKQWMITWFNRYLLQLWTIDNYDGHASYKGLGMDITTQHWSEERLTTTMFKSMRNHMTIVETEMDEVLDNQDTTTSKRRREWHLLKDIAVSICDDYKSDVMQYSEPNPPQPDIGDAVHQTRSPYPQDEEINIHDADPRGNHDGGSHFECSKDSEGTDEQKKHCASTIVDQEVVDVKGMWHQKNQAYTVKGWSDIDDGAMCGSTMGCMTFGKKKSQPRKKMEEDSDSEDGADEMVCNMTGDVWESLPFPIIIDSGACASVMPTVWCNHVPTKETLQSRVGDFYRAANGHNIYHEAERLVPMMTQEGSMRDMRFTVCDVSKDLGSVSQMCKIGHRVVFNPPWKDPTSSTWILVKGCGCTRKEDYTC